MLHAASYIKYTKQVKNVNKNHTKRIKKGYENVMKCGSPPIPL